jgi:hypothetical protein
MNWEAAMQDTQRPEELTEAEWQDIDPVFHTVVKQYGRGLFALVMAAGVAGEAMQVLGEAAKRDRKLAHAVGVLANAFNGVSNELVRAQGWSDELVAQCDRDIQLAFSGQITMPGQNIILDS